MDKIECLETPDRFKEWVREGGPRVWETIDANTCPIATFLKEACDIPDPWVLEEVLFLSRDDWFHSTTSKTLPNPGWVSWFIRRVDKYTTIEDRTLLEILNEG